jgi:hypothetical protein
MLINFRRQKCDQEKTEKILKYKNFTIQIHRNWNLECKNQSDTSNTKGKWNYLKIIQTAREQRTGITFNEGTTGNQSNWTQCTYFE